MLRIRWQWQRRGGEGHSLPPCVCVRAVLCAFWISFVSLLTAAGSVLARQDSTASQRRQQSLYQPLRPHPVTPLGLLVSSAAAVAVFLRPGAGPSNKI